MSSDEARYRGLVLLLRYEALLAAARDVAANANDTQALRNLIAAVRQFDDEETGNHDS